ncbi:MAG: adenylate/guanylate cyclase domain-containing protein [Proteobacteria bacterium]|nr:adenylate/guanylate cyclase domain-containing protein [Pseudomonadota bacterium]
MSDANIAEVNATNVSAPAAPEEEKRTRVVPVTFKIVISFALFILISNFVTNYINLIFNRAELYNLMNQLLIKDLKVMYTYCNNQWDILQFDKNYEESIQSIEQKGTHELKNEKAIVLGIKPDGEILFQASRITRYKTFSDSATLGKLVVNLKDDKDEGHIHFTFNNEEYFGIYKFNQKWNAFVLRAEELNEFYKESRVIFRNISIMIIVFTILMGTIGVLLLRFLLRFIEVFTTKIREMIESQELGIMDLSKATNDDITYLGAAFNSLSSMVNNLMYIFRKFTNQDIVTKAYQEREVKLEGQKKNLTILFSDIKSFTFITETLGTDIINLLNMYYDTAIREIVKFQGVIGSIIGDAILSVYGVFDNPTLNKSYQAVLTAYKLQEVTATLRENMKRIKANIEAEQGVLSPEQNKMYRAVLLEIGVGIDGGEVFYGTLGSYVRMTNTVIGDNVNAASRLEGLTRIYKIPVICSDFVKDDIEDNVENHGVHFVEIDTVMVKGKTEGKKIYWPILDTDYDGYMKQQVTLFSDGLKFYYDGDWSTAKQKFDECELQITEVFRIRTQDKCPNNWNGIWEMKSK